jgi:asparagine synthase (glutamine-hydrolysing)
VDRLISYLEENIWEIAYSRLLGFYNFKELKGLFENIEQLNKNLANKLSKLNTYRKDNRFKQAQRMDSIGFLSHNLMICDKSSMLASVEVRVPLLDEEIYTKGLQSRTSSLIPYTQLKKPLKILLSQLIPTKFVDRPKTGFNPPLDEMINKLGPKTFKDNLIFADSFINLTFANAIIDQHFSGESNNTYKIWQLFYFCRWLKVNSLNKEL